MIQILIITNYCISSQRFHQLFAQLSSTTVITEKLNQNYIKTTSAINSNLRNHRLMNKLLDRTFHKLVCVIELVRILKVWELIIKPEKRVGKEKTLTLSLYWTKMLLILKIQGQSDEAFKKYSHLSRLDYM